MTNYDYQFRSYYAKSNKMPKAAVVMRKNIDGALIDEINTHPEQVVVVVGDIVLVSLYCNLKKEDGGDYELAYDLKRLEEVIYKYQNRRIVIMMDSNSRKSLWGDAKTNHRGELMAKFIVEHELQLLNDNEAVLKFKSHFEKNGKIIFKLSYIDLSLIKNIDSNCIKWTKFDDLISSDHSMLLITINNKFKIENIEDRIIIDYNKTNFKLFLDSFNNLKPKNFNMKFEKFFINFNKSLDKSFKNYVKLLPVKYYKDVLWFNVYVLCVIK